MRVEAVGALDVVREAALDEDVPAPRRHASHHQPGARVADDEVADREVRRVRHVEAAVVDVLRAADLRTHPLAVGADLRPVPGRARRPDGQLLAEDAPPLQQQPLAGAEHEARRVAERLPRRLGRKAVPRVVPVVRIDVVGARRAEGRVPRLRREVGIRLRHEDNALRRPAKRTRIHPSLRLAEDGERDVREVVRAGIDRPLKRQLVPLGETGQRDPPRRHRHAVPALRRQHARADGAADVGERPRERDGRADRRHEFARAEHAEGGKRRPFVAEGEVRHRRPPLCAEDERGGRRPAPAAAPHRLARPAVHGERTRAPVPSARHAVGAPRLDGHLHGGARLPASVQEDEQVERTRAALPRVVA